MTNPSLSGKILRYWMPVIGWLALISLFSTDVFHAASGGVVQRFVRLLLLLLLPEPSPQTIALLNLGVRKLAHVLEYGVLVLLLYRGFCQDSREPHHGRWALGSLLVALAVAGLDEFHQSSTLRRSGTIRDVGFDTVGIVLGQIMLWARHSYKKDIPARLSDPS